MTKKFKTAFSLCGEIDGDGYANDGNVGEEDEDG